MLKALKQLLLRDNIYKLAVILSLIKSLVLTGEVFYYGMLSLVLLLIIWAVGLVLKVSKTVQLWQVILAVALAVLDDGGILARLGIILQ
jgi:hypothetical protein